MVEEWPVAAPSAADRMVERARVSGGGRLAAAVIDFFLNPAERLTEQERALMTAMLHGLIGSLADELRVRLPDGLARSSDIGISELVSELNRADLLSDERLVGILLRRADSSRVALAGDADSARQLLTRLASDSNPAIAAAAMSVALARGRSRDRVRASVEINDLDPSFAEHLVHSIAAVLARSCPGAENTLAEAAGEILERIDPAQGLEAAEERLMASLSEAGRLDSGLLLSLGARGEASLLAHALAKLAHVPAEDAWRMLVAPAEGQLALLLRMAGQARTTAAALFVSVGPALSLTDPAAEIDRFDGWSDGEVEAARRKLQLPVAFRRAAEALESHG